MVEETPVLPCPYTSAAVPPVRSTVADLRAPTILRSFWNCDLRALKACSLLRSTVVFLRRWPDSAPPRDCA
eukprot:8374577-Heterocapsa_arctica.AAC.1